MVVFQVSFETKLYGRYTLRDDRVSCDGFSGFHPALPYLSDERGFVRLACSRPHQTFTTLPYSGGASRKASFKCPEPEARIKASGTTLILAEVPGLSLCPHFACDPAFRNKC